MWQDGAMARIDIRRLVLGLSLAMLATPAWLEAADWPVYRGDLRHSSATSEQLPKLPIVLWQYTAPEPPRKAWSGEDGKLYEGKEIIQRVKFDDALHVTVAGGRMYFGSSVDHHVHCRDVATGAELWRFPTGGPVRLAPTIAEGRVYFGSDDGVVYALDATSGALVWKLRAGPADEWMIARGEMISRWPIRTSVLVEDGVAFFGAGIFPHEEVYFTAVNSDDGKVLWRRDNISHTDAGRDDLSPQGYLLSSGNLVVCPSGRSLPAVFNKRTGELVQKRVRGLKGTVIGGTEAFLSEGQLYTFGAHEVVAVDQETGDTIYGIFPGKQMAVVGNSAFVTNGQKVMRLDRSKYAESSRKRYTIQSSIDALTSKLRTAGDQAAAVNKLIAEAKERLSAHVDAGVTWSTPAQGDSALIATKDQVVIGGRGHVTAFDTTTGEEVWTLPVDGEARGLAVAAERLFVSTTTGKIYVLGDAAKKSAPATDVAAESYPQDPLAARYEAAAQQILERTGVKHGFCLVLGGEQGRLAYELAKRSALHVFCVEPDAEKSAAARKALMASGYYGHRVVVHQLPLGELPFANYFANLVVSDTQVLTGRVPNVPASQIARHVKPVGGVVCLGGQLGDTAGLATWLQNAGFGDGAEPKSAGAWVTLTRGALPGAGSWTHQYGNPGNTAASEDRLIKGGLGVLWYGDPGPSMMVDRHQGAMGPLAVAGRMIVQGDEKIVAYDAYNGIYLWEYNNPEAIRTGVFNNVNPSNLAASDDSVFMFSGDKCREIDLVTGQAKRTHALPEGIDATYQWGYVAHYDGFLYGTATVREEIKAKNRRRGKATEDSTDMVFAIDLATGKHAWHYRGKSISHHTLAIGGDGVFFVDSSITSEQRTALLRQDKSELKSLSPEEAKKAEERLKKADVRMVIALDHKTGKKQWAEPVDVTDCSEIGIGGGKLTMIYANGALVLGGANANGHYWQQFVAGEFSQRRLVTLSATSGSLLWHKDANYRHRPIVIGDRLIAEPWSFDLFTGKQYTRESAITGKEEPWSIMRTGHHCGMLTGCDNMLFFRSGATGFYDLKADTGTQHFAGHRLGCWINAIPAGGLVMIPEAGAGCICLFSIESTIVMEPREPRRPWAIASSVSSLTPVKHLAINLGAPGDRRDDEGLLWYAYPRPKPYKRTSLEVDLAPEIKFFDGGEYAATNEASAQVVGGKTSWLFSSAAQGIQSAKVLVRGEGDGPAAYRVRLYFADLDNASAGQRVFDVKLQGDTVLKKFDVVAASGGKARALIREFDNVLIERYLTVQFEPADERGKLAAMPLLSAIELIASDAVADPQK